MNLEKWKVCSNYGKLTDKLIESLSRPNSIDQIPFNNLVCEVCSNRCPLCRRKDDIFFEAPYYGGKICHECFAHQKAWIEYKKQGGQETYDMFRGWKNE